MLAASVFRLEADGGELLVYETEADAESEPLKIISGHAGRPSAFATGTLERAEALLLLRSPA